MEDLVVIHHELGHVVYSIMYGHQLIANMDGANPGISSR